MRKYGLTILIVFLLFFGWYFFVKNHDYRITFKTAQAPGIVYSNIVGWNNWEPNTNKTVTTVSKTPFSKISQELTVSDSIIEIDWRFKRINDSTTKVFAYLKDKDHSFYQKLKAPFIKTDFVLRSLKTVKRIKKGLEIFEETYRVSTIQRSVIPEKHCAYVTVESKLHEKANKMIQYNAFVMDYITKNELQLTGKPFLEVLNWNVENDMIIFNFCFPISKKDSYSNSEEIKIKTTDQKEALKVTFNGNYRISDKAWFTIMDYAERNNIEIDLLPIEFYFNNPHHGGSWLKWKAEVYMPIKK